MQIDWKKYVDKIYCIQYIFNKDRTEILNNELYRVDIIQSGIYDVVEQFPSPIYDVLYKQFNHRSSSTDLNTRTYFNSLLGHYSAIKRAYLDNLDYVLILEDDCRFLNNKQEIADVLDKTIPEFKKIEGAALYGGSISHKDNGEDAGKTYSELTTVVTIDSYSNIPSDELFAGAAFNIYNRPMMKLLIDFVEELNYAIVDEYHIIYEGKPVTYMILNKHICLQQSWIYLMYNTCKDYNMFKPTEQELEIHKNDPNWFGRDIEKIFNDIKKYFHY